MELKVFQISTNFSNFMVIHVNGYTAEAAGIGSPLMFSG
jgi:hypothetical protein